MKSNPLQQFPRDNRMLLDYLLDRLAESERDRLEQRLFEDDAFFMELETVEDELIAGYLNGDMATDLKNDFETDYLKRPAHREKFEFVKSVRGLKRSDESPGAGTPGGSVGGVVPISFWRRRIAVPVWQAGLATAASLTLLFGWGWMARVANGLKIELEQARSGKPVVVTDETLKEKLETERTRAAELERQLAQEHAARERLETQIARLTPPKSRPVEPESSEAPMLMKLFSSALRGGGDEDKHELNSKVSTVRFKLMISDPRSFKNLSATISTAEGAVVATRSGLKLRKLKAGGFVEFTLPADRLPMDDYQIRLKGTLSDGSTQDLPNEGFSFKIVRPDANSN